MFKVRMRNCYTAFPTNAHEITHFFPAPPVVQTLKLRTTRACICYKPTGVQLLCHEQR